MSHTPEVSYGYNELIPMSQVVARTKVRLQLKDSTDFDGEIELFLNEALASLGTKFNFIKKNCRLTIENGKCKLPRNYHQIIGVRPVYTQPVSTNNANLFNTVVPFIPETIYISQPFLSDCQDYSPATVNLCPLVGTMEIVGGYLRFPLPCLYDEVIISYTGYATTEDCVMEIAAAFERGISEYAVWKMLSTYEQIKSEDPRREMRLQEAKQDWIAQRAKIVGDGFANDWEVNKYVIKRMFNALLQDQNSVTI